MQKQRRRGQGTGEGVSVSHSFRASPVPRSPSAVSPTPVRVMYIIWSLGLGGAEQVVLRLAAGLDRRRFEPMICCLDEPGPFAPAAARHGIRVVALGKRGPLDLAIIGRLIRLMQAQRIAVVHTHLWGANFWGRIAARFARVPVVIAHEHGMQPWRGSFHFLADRWLSPWTDRIIFVSHQVRELYLQRSGADALKCRVISNGVSSNGMRTDRQALRQALGWDSADRIVLSIGRLSPEKGYDDLLRAFAAATLPSTHLVLVGGGPEHQALHALHLELGLRGRVTFAGVQHEVARWLSAADLYVQPSRREGLPLALLEAMAAGVPVIATRVGDVGHLITDGQDGHLVPSNDPTALAAKMTTILRALDHQRPLIDAAKRLVREKYSEQQMVHAVESMYEELLGMPSPRARSAITTPGGA